MKKVFATLTVLAMLSFGTAAMAQEETVAAAAEATTEQVVNQPAQDETAAVEAPAEESGVVAPTST